MTLDRVWRYGLGLVYIIGILGLTLWSAAVPKGPSIPRFLLLAIYSGTVAWAWVEARRSGTLKHFWEGIIWALIVMVALILGFGIVFGPSAVSFFSGTL